MKRTEASIKITFALSFIIRFGSSFIFRLFE